MTLFANKNPQRKNWGEVIVPIAEAIIEMVNAKKRLNLARLEHAQGIIEGLKPRWTEVGGSAEQMLFLQVCCSCCGHLKTEVRPEICDFGRSWAS